MAEPQIDFASGFARLRRDDEAELAVENGGMSVRLVRIAPGAVGRWDSHADGPETAIVWSGDFTVEFRDAELPLTAGQLCIVPAGAEHRGVSRQGAEVVLLRRLPAA